MNSTLRCLCFCFIVLVAQLSGQSDDIFNDYNMQPEVHHFVGYPQGQVNHKGDLNLSIPIMTVPGRGGLDFDITFDYGTPIQRAATASWIGLGWNFDPGSITRDPQGGISEVAGMAAATSVDFTSIDTLQPDMYYLTLPRHGTWPLSRSNRSTFYNDSLENAEIPYFPRNESQFYTHTWKPWKIDVDTSYMIIGNDTLTYRFNNLVNKDADITRFTVTAEDGMRYVFGMPSVAWFKAGYYTNDTRDQYISAWRIVAILSPECPDYDEMLFTPDETGNWIHFKYRFDASNDYYMDVFESNRYHNTYLWKIETPTHTAEFVTGSRDDELLDNDNVDDAHRKLTTIKLYRRDYPSEILRQVDLTQDYSLAKLYSVSTEGKLTLKAIDFKGQNGSAEPGYEFSYADNPTLGTTDTRKYSDHFGFYDTGEYGGEDLDKDDAEAWSLTKITYPTGATDSIEYENDVLFDGIDSLVLKFQIFEPTYVSVCLRDTGYAIAGRFYQGGSRVTRIIRSNTSEEEITEEYSYGEGRPTGIPPQFFVQDFLTGNYYTPGNRGTVAVIYTHVLKTVDDILEYRYYTVPGFNNINDTLTFTAGLLTYYVEMGSPTYSTLLVNNVAQKWGRLKKTHIETAGHTITEETIWYPHTEFEMSDTYKLACLSEDEVYVHWWNPLVKQTKRTERGLTTITETKYENSPRLISEQFTHGSLDDSRGKKYTYAFEADSFATGGYADSADSDNIIAKNNLSAIAQESSFYQDSLGQRTYFSSTVSKWSKEEISIDPPAVAWKPSHNYLWNDTSFQSTEPEFSAWVSGSPGSKWLLSSKFNSYDDFGRATEIEDSLGNKTKVFYGDNDSPRSNSSSAGDFDHAFLTGVEKDSLFLEYLYEDSTGRVISMRDANGNSTSYGYDDFGRLAEIVGPDSLIKTGYCYYLATDTSGSIKSFIETSSYPNGNLLSNGSFENFSPQNLPHHWNPVGSGYIHYSGTGNAILGHAYVRINEAASYSYTGEARLKTNQPYLLSLWVRRVGSTSTTFRAKLNGCDAASFSEEETSSNSSYVTTSGKPALQSVMTDNTWRRIWMKFSISDSSIFVNPYLEVTVGDYVYVDHIMITPLYRHVDDDTYPEGVEPVVTIDYYDGWLRKIQSQISGGPYRDAEQIITHYSYDQHGRQNREWLPFPNDDPNASAARVAYSSGAADSNATYNVYDSYDGTNGPDAGRNPFSEKVLTIGDFVRYAFPPGEIHHPNEEIANSIFIPDPYNNLYWGTSPYKDKRIIVNRMFVNESDTTGYPRHSLRISTVFNEAFNYRETYSNKFDETLREITFDQQAGPSRNSQFAYADSFANFRTSYVDFQAETNQSIPIYWKATFSNQSGSATLAIDTVYGGSGLFSISKDTNFVDTVYTLNAVADKAYYFKLTASAVEAQRVAPGGHQYLMQSRDEADRGDRSTQDAAPTGIGIGLPENDKYVSSFVDFYNDRLDTEHYPPKTITEFVYDEGGNMIELRPPNYFENPTGTDSTDWISTFSYDTRGQVLLKVSPDADSVRYMYDVNGNLRRSADAVQHGNDESMFFTYDFANRLVKTGKINIAITSLDPDHWGFENVDSWQLAKNVYDAAPTVTQFPFNQVEDSHYPASQANLKGRLSANAYKSDGKWQITTYSYDAEGRVVEKYVISEDIDPLQLRFSYDSQGKLLQRSAHIATQRLYQYYGYDDFGRLSWVVSSDTAMSEPENSYVDVRYTYNDFGQLEKFKLAQYGSNAFEEVLEYQYHTRGWLTEINDIDSNNEPFAAFYNYRPDGNIMSSHFYNAYANLAGEDRYRYDYSYDDIGRLTSADYFYDSTGWQSSSHFDVDTLTYDANGNILTLKRNKETGTVIDDLVYEYGTSNRLTGIEEENEIVTPSPEDWDASNSSFTYDSNGNLKTVSENGTTLVSSMIYDERNLPVQITRDGTLIRYRYNASGQRIYKKVGSGTAEHYLMDDDQILGVIDENGDLLYWNIIGDGVVGRLSYD